MVVLYVDDDSEDREIFSDVLKEIDPSIVLLSAKDGEEALTILNNDFIDLPDVIFLDINMPRMDGYQCLKEIKKNMRLKNVPVIMYSTFLNPKKVEEYKPLTAGFMSKPTTYATAFDVLKKVIKDGKI